MRRLEIAPGVFRDCGETPQRILDQISDPVVQKILVMRWRSLGEITDAETETLIRANHLEGA